jgi:hypothetical protein
MRSSLYRIVSVLVGVTAGIGSPVAAQVLVDKSPVSGLAAPNAPSGWGVNIHFTDPQLGEMERFKEAGYRFARMDIEWDSVEKTPGHYDFAAYDRLVEHLARVDARPLFILDYGNDLYQKDAPRSPEARAAFARFAGAAVRHFRGKNVVWEIWNEPNLGKFWPPAPDAEEYAALALETAKAVRAADPDAILVAPGSSQFPLEFFETVFSKGLLSYLDAVSVHPYRGQAPETAAADYTRLRGLIARYAPAGKKQLPIIASEWGYSTSENGIPEERQAQYLTRMWLANLASGVNLSIFYDWRDDDDAHRFGTVRRDLAPKPSFVAAQKLLQSLNGYAFRHRLKGENKHDWKLLFQKGNSSDLLLVTWSSDPKASPQRAMPSVQSVPKQEQKRYRKLASVRIPYGAIAVPQSDILKVPVVPWAADRRPGSSSK